MSNPEISFGIGRCCINPQSPVSLAGYFNLRPWDHVLDDLEVRVLLLQKGGQSVGLIHFDLITVPTALYEHLLAALASDPACDAYSGKNLIISATHTHTAPEVRLQNDGSSSEYYALLASQTLAAFKQALAGMQEGRLAATQTADSRFLFNRRYWMKDGKVVTNPPKGDPNIARPEGEIDPEIPMMVILKDDKPFVVISSIVNHTDTIGGCGVSADWPGFLRRDIESRLAPGAMLMPLVGCSGNINHFDVYGPPSQNGYDCAERIGRGYAESVAKALQTLEPVNFSSIRLLQGQAFSRTRQLEAAEIAEAEAVMRRYPDISISRESAQELTSEDLAKKTPFALKFFAARLLEMRDIDEERVFNLVGFELGRVFIASMPSEPFTEFGLRLRKSCFPRHICLVSSLANGTGGPNTGGGYIPNSWNYGRGGYETTPRSNPFAPDTGEKLLAAWKKLAETL